jgi:hypothetical protein
MEDRFMRNGIHLWVTSCVLSVLSVLSILLFTSLSAFAAVGGTIVERSPGAMHQDWNELEGSLACPTGKQNADQPCALQFTDRETGKVYDLTEQTAQTMQLYRSGVKNVAIEGRVEGDQTLVVHGIRSL